MQTAKKMTPIDDYALKNIIDKLPLIYIDNYENVPIYSSITCFFISKLYRPLHKQHVVTLALKALRTADSNDGCGQKLRVLTGSKASDYDRLWVVQDDEAVILMFPEDFLPANLDA